MSEQRLVRHLFSLLCFCVVFTTSVQGARQTGAGEQASASANFKRPTLSGRAKKQLKDKLESAVPTAFQVVKGYSAPLEITGATLSSLKMEGNYDPGGNPVHLINDYVMKLSLRLSNRYGRTATALGLEFKDSQGKNSFFVYRYRIDIGPAKSVTLEIPFMVLTGDPAHLSVALYGAAYDDSMVWGIFPVPGERVPTHATKAIKSPDAPSTNPAAPPIKSPEAPAANPTTPALRTSVDSKPRPLNSPRPRFTEHARINGVCGVVRLRVLVGAEGSVTKVYTLSTLPDWLTEQAIESAYEMKFEPARKDGKGVAYWMPVEVEFNLK